MTAPSVTGRVLGGRYRLDTVLGSGGMGAVFRATDTTTGARVAVKLIKPGQEDPTVIDRFRREGALTARLHDEHIVHLLEVGEDSGDLYLVMELLAGVSLKQRLASGDPMPVHEALRVARDVAHALAVTHAAGFAHRDVKPANIMLVPADARGAAAGAERAVLLDFGIARSLEHGATMTSTGFVVGTAGYIAPEVSLGGRPFDARADLYSLGVVLYEALVGAPVFVAANAFALAARQASEDPIAPHLREPTIPADVSALVMRLIARDPARRPATAALLVEAITALLDNTKSPALTAEGEALSERNEYTELSYDPVTHIVTFSRTAVPYPSADDAGQAFSAIRDAFPVSGRGDKLLLVDMRDAPMRTDPRFAKIISGEMPRLYEGWRRVASVVRTPEGQEQLTQLRRRAGQAGAPFLDMDAALAWLLAEDEGKAG